MKAGQTGKARSKHSSGIEKKLLSYSVAAGAALAVAGPSQAAIHYSGPKDIVINNANPMETIDLNGDGTQDFAFAYTVGTSYFFTSYSTYFGTVSYSGTYYYRGLTASGGPNNRFLGSGSEWWGQPYRLGAGDEISAGAPGSWLQGGTQQGSALNLTSSDNSWQSWSYGNFIDRKGYLGVRFDIDGQTHYGWIEYEGTGFVEGKITGWAYEDVAGMGIQAGDTTVQAEPVPTLNEWGLLFLMGLILVAGAAWLRRQSGEETQAG